jgi:hypothetical protein
MNLSAKISPSTQYATLSSTSEYKFYKLAHIINLHSCIWIVIIGLIGNLITMYLLKSKRIHLFRKPRLHKTHFMKPEYRGSTYIYALALSDSLFLLSHLFEDILPSLDANSRFFQLVNSYELFCKLISFVRNGSRISSSYLVVSFAFERYIVVSTPLKRLSLYNRKFTHFIIIFVMFASYLSATFTLFINGLRTLDPHERVNQKYECDVKAEYKSIYDYIISVYILFSILIPIIFVFYFNTIIINVIINRKNMLFQKYSLSFTNKHTDGANETSLVHLKSNTNKPQYEMCSTGSNSKTKPTTTDSTTHFLNLDEINPIKLKNQHNLSVKTFSSTQQLSRMATSNACEENRLLLKTSSVNTLNHSNQKIADIRTILNSDNVLRTQKINDSSKVTLILILISIFFVALNLPYITAWLVFFVPFKKQTIQDDEIFFKYSFVKLAEILHLLNFCVNIFLYCMVSRVFRRQLKLRLFFCK